jgi:hypothetical protein
MQIYGFFKAFGNKKIPKRGYFTLVIGKLGALEKLIKERTGRVQLIKLSAPTDD